jgi:sterol desaturase/sphingolipid hydroxylase (fatty acid hydroxylase superfamily)
MQLADLFSPYWFMLTTLIFFVIITGRYFLVAGLFYCIFYLWFPAKWKARKLNSKPYQPDQFKKEIIWSMITALIFSIAGTITVLIWQKGYTKVYTDTNLYGWAYLPVSLVVMMLLHETYYYWLHRWMHNKKIFKIVHKVHHDSNITSPFTAFSFHPFEGLLQAVFLPVILLFLPVHYFVILFQLTIMTLSSVINHLNIEIYPKNFNENIIGRWLIGSTHHSLHHRQFKYNFGLYFTFWDKLKKTESPLYDQLFINATSPAAKQPVDQANFSKNPAVAKLQIENPVPFR